MFGKAVILIKIILFWGLITVTLVEAGRQKKDVHHMIFLKENRRPAKSHRHKDYKHHNYYEENSPKKSRKKPEENKYKGLISTEDSVEQSSYEELVHHRPKSKPHHYHHTANPNRHHKRHNSPKHYNHHKKHHTNEHRNLKDHKKSKSKEHPTHTLPHNWTPMSSKEIFGNEYNQFFTENGLGKHAQGYIQSIPLEITTPLPLQLVNPFHLQSTIYPPLSFLNQNVQKDYEQSLVGTVESYKPFDYSILKQKPQTLDPIETFQEEVASSNIANVKHSGGKHPLSIIADSSSENFESQEKQGGEKNSEEGGKSEKTIGKGKRTRGSIRYRIRHKN